MPVSKTPPRRKQPAAAAEKAPAGPALPDRRAMEAYLATIAGNRDDAISRAQEVMYDAREKTTSRSRISLARKALAISPLCADADDLLAEEGASLGRGRGLLGQ